MHPLLSRNLYLVKEHVGLFKAANNFDIYDPQSGEMILHCREDRMGVLTRLLRFTDYKRMTPFCIEIRTPDGQPILTVQRSIALFVSRVDVFDENQTPLGGFQQKFFSLGGKFNVLGSSGQTLCTLTGKWTGWDFRFMSGETELAHVSKKWSGWGQELLTSADTYLLEIADHVPSENPIRQLILAAVMCIDMVLKE